MHLSDGTELTLVVTVMLIQSLLDWGSHLNPRKFYSLESFTKPKQT